MVTVPSLPGVYYEQVPARPAPSPLRSDVAGLIGRTRRGPAGVSIRVEGLREYRQWFGGLHRDEDFTYAARGYFENGGEVAHVVRVIGSEDRLAHSSWDVGFNTGALYRIRASSPGAWADRLRVDIRYIRASAGGASDPVLEFRVKPRDEPLEQFQIVLEEPKENETVRSLDHRVAAVSAFIRLDPQTQAVQLREALLRNSDGPRVFDWLPIELTESESATDNSVVQNYRQALKTISDVPEVAILAMPGMDQHLDRGQMIQLLSTAAEKAAELQDRMVVTDAPIRRSATQRIHSSIDESAFESVAKFTADLRGRLASPVSCRTTACYFPYLRVSDPLGGVAAPLRTISPSGHAAGVISRMDRDRGAHHTPANSPIEDAVDIETMLDRRTSGQLSEDGVNLIRCAPGRGLRVWGGRTLDSSREGRFLSHRRFIHRLVRAIRRVAEPLVFETNGPDLWFTLVRAISTVLLEAFRSGALQGDRPEQAFRVVCDERLNSIADREQGRVLCEIALALAAPMEFITIRVAIGQSGQVEVFDS